MTYPRILPLALLAMLASCAELGIGTGARRVVAPDGDPAIAIQCWRSPLRCIERSGQECPRGYELLGKRDVEEEHPLDAPARHGEGAPRLTYHGQWLIRCHVRS